MFVANSPRSPAHRPRGRCELSTEFTQPRHKPPVNLDTTLIRDSMWARMDAMNTTPSARMQGSPQVFAMRAYGAPRAMPQAAPVPQQPTTQPRTPTNVQRLVAATVPGKIDFIVGANGASTPMPATGALPMYRNPADKNAAAVGVEAGRMLDIEG